MNDKIAGFCSKCKKTVFLKEWDGISQPVYIFPCDCASKEKIHDKEITVEELGEFIRCEPKGEKGKHYTSKEYDTAIAVAILKKYRVTERNP